MSPSFLRYILPFRVRSFWYTNAPYGDTTKVLKQTSVAVPAGNFTNVFCIAKTVGYVTNSWTKDTLYFKNRVGLVKFKQNEYNLGPVTGDGTWELVRYTLK